MGWAGGERVEGWKAAGRARRRQGGTWMSLELKKKKKRYFEKVVLSPGKKVCLELTKVRCGWIEAVLVCESGRVALLWNDVLGREIGDFCG